ncbi:hypothetical protein CN141_26925 [Sinorhizobium meliloti]|uniref:hypothetical protein n=1 Tax=Rhizobium meliloti TaxID=382 RepID=UPI000FD78AF6|nr:hypothetical protein [Sinorhizobium meliloti]RVG51657.1 hypothetical protein CN226_18050 [Sinorhizobium meliloti]RVL52968.1 hypothetical protein CN141_26925 [Sinorhizobium meliloti]
MQHDELQRISDAGCAAVHLRVMSEQSDGRLNESLLSQVLDVYAHHLPIPMKPPLCSEMIAPPVSGMISPPV